MRRRSSCPNMDRAPIALFRSKFDQGSVGLCWTVGMRYEKVGLNQITIPMYNCHMGCMCPRVHTAISARPHGRPERSCLEQRSVRGRRHATDADPDSETEALIDGSPTKALIDADR